MILANTQHYPFEDCLLLSEVESAKVCPSNLGETMCLGKKWNASNRAPSVDEEFYNSKMSPADIGLCWLYQVIKMVRGFHHVFFFFF